VENAREEVATLIGSKDPQEIIFTSGGTESDNLTLRGVIAAAGGGGHIVTTAIEHSAILDTCKYLEETGVQVAYVPPDRLGRVAAEDIAEAIRPETRLVSVMWANNETGTVQPLEEVTAICRERNVLFHTDGVQAMGKISADVETAKVDFLSASAHKINGPKGVGFLYIRKGSSISPLITGGGQEKNLRPGTENVPGIVGLGEACRLVREEGASERKRICDLRDRLEREAIEHIPDVVINGESNHRVPGTTNMGFLGVEGETLLIRLDLEGFATSTGSACSVGSTEPSHVLQAMDIPRETVRGSLRFSLGWGNTEEDVSRLLKILPDAVEKIRSMAPRTYDTSMKAS
jgi:cysteine desulfurase